MERLIDLEIGKLSMKRLDITSSVRNFDDLYRFLLSNYWKPHFLFFRRNEDNAEIFLEIGKLAGIREEYN